jgi:hypothetical protein
MIGREKKVSSDKYSQFKMSYNMKFMLNDDKNTRERAPFYEVKIMIAKEEEE